MKVQEKPSSVTFNIYGGNNQILPNATQAVQNFCNQECSASANESVDTSLTGALEKDKEALSIYIDHAEDLKAYVTQLASCRCARDLGEVVATICQKEPRVTADIIVKQRFIELLLPFVPSWKQGRTIDNIRVAINNAWVARKKAVKSSLR